AARHLQRLFETSLDVDRRYALYAAELALNALKLRLPHVLVVSRDEILRLGEDAQAVFRRALMQVGCRQHAQVSNLPPADSQCEPLRGTLAHEPHAVVDFSRLSHCPASND